MTAEDIRVDDPRDRDVRALLERHLTFCLSETPPEHSFALDVSGLLDPKVTFISYRDGETVLGVAAIKELGVDVHARSLFLQGLWFLAEDKLPQKLKAAAPHLASIRERLKDAGTTPLAAALAFALNRPEVDVGIVGVTAAAELDEIVAAAATSLPDLDWAACALDNPVVLTPSLW